MSQEKYNTQKQHARLNEMRILSILERKGKSYSEIKNEFQFSNAGLVKILQRLQNANKIEKIRQGKTVIYKARKKGTKWLSRYYFENMVIDLFDRKYVYWHDNLSADNNHAPLIYNLGSLHGFTNPEWIKTEGIEVHQLFSNKFSDAYLPIYPVIPGLCKNALTGYQERLIEFAMKQDHDLSIGNGENKVIIAFEFDLDRIAQTLNDIRKQKDVKS